jgi:hypothetical protein
MIDQSVLDGVIAAAEGNPFGDSLLASLRGSYPGVHFTCCMDDDINVNARPLVSRPGFNLYLVNSSNHCSTFTNDPDIASGIVLAEVLED